VWEVIFEDAFDLEFEQLPEEVQNELYAQAAWIEKLGPEAGRSRVDTLKGSRYAKMKELRFDAAGGAWRVAFAFDPKRRAILLVAGDKSGGSEKRFYQRLIRKADARYERHLEGLPKTERMTSERKKP
jgi:hypothetical protein